MQGLRKNIFIQIVDESADLSQSTADTANVSGSTSLLGIEASNDSSEVE